MLIERAKKLYFAGEYKKAEMLYNLFEETYPELSNIVSANKSIVLKKISKYEKNESKENSNIKVSIIIPVYNNYKYLDECINSVLNQTLTDIEIIIIDDGSSDERVKELINKYSKIDKRIVPVFKKNTGYGHTMNLGIKIAKGEFIALVESDDFVSKDMYQILYSIGKRLDVDIVKSDINIFYDKKEGRAIYNYNITDKKWYNKLIIPELAIESFDASGFLGTTSAIYSRKFIMKYNIKYNETQGAAYQDIGFWFKTILCADSIYYVNKAFYHVRRDNESSSVHDGKKLEPVRYEYDSVYRFMIKNRHLSPDFLSLYIKRKFLSYSWCLNRADESIKSTFINNFIMDFKEHQLVGKLDTKLFNDKDINALEEILNLYNPSKHKFACIYTATLAHGGLERVACDLSIALKKIGYGVVFILLYDKDFSYDFRGEFIISDLENNNLLCILENSYIIFDFKFKKAVPPIEKIVDYCIKKYSYKYIATVHNVDERCRHYFEHIFLSMHTHGVKEIKKIICVSDAVKDSIIKNYGNMHNLVTLHNPIDIEKIGEHHESHSAFQDYILLCCRLDATYVKGIDIALKSFLSSNISNTTKLICAGNGVIDNVLLDEIKEHKNFSNIIFLGFSNDVYSLMKNAKFLISPSRYEGFSMVILECLACGTPVLATNVGGAKEVIIHGENGFITKSDSVEEFSKCIDHMEKVYSKMKGKTISSINKFSLQHYMHELQSILEFDIKVSIIIPVYNGEDYIEKCLESVLNQSIHSIEVICIDDGSIDNSKEKIFSFNDPRIIYKYQDNQGAGVARNSALQFAHGEFIAFMDCDDFYPTKYSLETLYLNAKKNGANISGGRLYYYDGNQKIPCSNSFFNFPKEEMLNYRDWQYDYGYQLFIYNSSFLRKNKLNFPTYRRFQDPVFFAKAMLCANEFYVCTEYVYVYRSRKNKVSWDYQKVFDLLSGIYDNLMLAKKYSLKKLFEHVHSHYYQHEEQVLSIVESFPELSALKKKIIAEKIDNI